MDLWGSTIELFTGAAFMMNGIAGFLFFAPGFVPCRSLVVGSILVAWGILKADSTPPMNLPPPYPPTLARTRLGPPGWLSGKTCVRCGSNNPPDSRFCAACGAPF